MASLKALALVEPPGNEATHRSLPLGPGKTYLRSGRQEQVLEHLEIAAAMYREMEMTFWLKQAEAETNG
jgi:hypothetical protein